MKVYHNQQPIAPMQAATRSATSKDASVQFQDKRPEAVMQRQQQVNVMNSSQVKQMQRYQEMADNGLKVGQHPAMPVTQLKRSKDVVHEELSAHLNEKDSQEPKKLADPTNLFLPVGFGTKSLDESEKYYDDSFASGVKILAAIDKVKTVGEKKKHFEETEAILNKNYEDTLKYTVSVPKEQQSSSEDSLSGGDDFDFLDGGDLRERRPEATTEDEDVHVLNDGQKVKKYIMETGRQANRGETDYNNYYEPVMKTFVAARNFGDRDKEKADKAPVATNADIIAAQIQALKRAQLLRKEEDRANIEIKTLKRHKIINQQTLNTILWSDKSTMKFKYDYSMKSDGREEPRSQDFTALLGSPNGRAGGWLFVHYAELLGLEPINEIWYDAENIEIKYGKPEEKEAGDDEGGGNVDDVWGEEGGF